MIGIVTSGKRKLRSSEKNTATIWLVLWFVLTDRSWDYAIAKTGTEAPHYHTKAFEYQYTQGEAPDDFIEFGISGDTLSAYRIFQFDKQARLQYFLAGFQKTPSKERFSCSDLSVSPEKVPLCPARDGWALVQAERLNPFLSQ
jgi:hypothetical protein